MMNSVYNGHIQDRPDLTEALCHLLFKRGQVFKGEEVKAREKGDPYCELTAGLHELRSQFVSTL